MKTVSATAGLTENHLFLYPLKGFSLLCLQASKNDLNNSF